LCKAASASHRRYKRCRSGLIRADVVARGRQHADLPFDSSYREGETRTCIVVNGAHETDVIENISFTDVHITYDGGGTAQEATRNVPQMAGEYFEIGTPPAYGLYARNVRGLTLDNVRFQTLNPDLRPAIVFDHVEDATVANVTMEANEQARSAMRMIASKDVLISAPRVLPRVANFLQQDGTNSNIVVQGGNVST